MNAIHLLIFSFKKKDGETLKMMMKASFDTLNKKFTPIHQEQPSTRSLNYNLSLSTHSTSPLSTMLDVQGPAKTRTLLLL